MFTKRNQFDSWFYYRLVSTRSIIEDDSMLRERINNELKSAMRSKEQTKVLTLRLINAAIKDRDIADRVKIVGDDQGIGDDDILQLLQSMIKQRRDSIEAYSKGGRDDLVNREKAEIEVIRNFLPEQLTEDEIASAVNSVIDDTGASSLKEMGLVMSTLRQEYAGKIDFGKASEIVKARLAQS